MHVSLVHQFVCPDLVHQFVSLSSQVDQVFVDSSTNTGEGLVKRVMYLDIEWTCGGVAQSQNIELQVIECTTDRKYAPWSN